MGKINVHNNHKNSIQRLLSLYKIKSKFYNFTYKNEKIEVFNLRKFCRDNNLDQGAMTRVNKGKQITHKGYSK
jgi:hypothetical protein